MSAARRHSAQERLQGAGHNTDSDTILGLESGANDYVTNPFRFGALLARIRAQLRLHEASESAVFTIGP
jgi:DNA-binding response OmpR family regulator